MRIFGIVAEYDPFHSGHAYLLARARERLGRDAAAVAMMSGNWTQRGKCALADKWTRARLALLGGVDLVLELPTVWAASSAQSFACGAVDLLCACGVIDTLCFGSECGDLDALKAVAECLDGEEYAAALRRHLERGGGFAACRAAAVSDVMGRRAGLLLSKPNNNLGVEYLCALRARGSGIEPVTVLRRGAGHDETAAGEFCSASYLRGELSCGRWEAARYLPEGGEAVLRGAPLADPARIERAMLALLRTMTAEDWAALPDAGEAEGLPHRLERAGRACRDVEEFFTLAKTKRYARARLDRLALWAYLGLSADYVPQTPPYLRVLGMSERGRQVLAQMRKSATLPVIVKPTHAKRLAGAGRSLAELEARCTDLYDLCLDTIPAPSREWRENPVLLP